MAEEQPMWGNNQAVAPTLGAATITVDLGDNFTIKVHHLSMIKDCQFNRRAIIQIFYHGLGEATQAILDAGGIFLYKTPNKAHQLLKDRVFLKLDWSKEMKAKPIRKTTSFTKSSKDSKLIEKMEALTTKIDSQFKDIKGEIRRYEMDAAVVEALTYYRIKPNAKTTVIHDDSEDKVHEAKKEVEPSSSKQIKSHPPPLKAYKPKIAYPQRRHGMPNYGKFLKDLIATKVTKEELDALLDDSKPFSTTSEKISESSLDFEFMEIKMEEIPEKEEEVKDNFEELPFEEN
nr:reverse transcriptase domain-containing protein [Tanacetum cinerariifolium]